MKSKTLSLISYYHRLLKEQGENPQAPPPEQQGPNPEQDVVENPQVDDKDVMPLTSEGENELISRIVDAAIFQPTPKQMEQLRNFQYVLKSNPARFKNSREEVLMPVLSMMEPMTQGEELKPLMNQVS